MGRFNHDRHCFGTEFFFKQVGNRLGHSLLHLRPMGHNLDDAGQLTEPHHLATRKVANVGLAHEWQQVMFAGAVEADVFDQDDFVVIFAKHLPQVRAGIFMQSRKEFGIHAGNAGRRLQQTFAVGVLANGPENFAHRAFDASMVHSVDQRSGLLIVLFTHETTFLGPLCFFTDRHPPRPPVY